MKFKVGDTVEHEATNRAKYEIKSINSDIYAEIIHLTTQGKRTKLKTHVLCNNLRLIKRKTAIIEVW